MQDNFYQVLGVARTASPAEVRAAFVRLVKQHHPDMTGGGAVPRRLHDIQVAYRCLSDPEARAQHDRLLETAERAHFERQRAVQRRLRRYDRRHPYPVPHQYRRVGWRSLAMVVLGVAFAAHLWMRVLG